MRVKLIKTDGPWLMATIQHGERQLCVMDEFSFSDISAPNPGEEFDVELSANPDEDESWEELFRGNPEKRKDLDAIEGWSYRAFGEIVSIHPVVVDCGIIAIDNVIDTNDPRVIGEYIAFMVTRLDATVTCR